MCHILQQTKESFTRRIVVLGDIHGDYQQCIKSLVMCGVTDGNGHWIANDNILVQMGDLLDRGDDSKAVMDLFIRLQEEGPFVWW